MNDNARDGELMLLASRLKALAEWAVTADETKLMAINDDFKKLLLHLQTSEIVEDAVRPPDLADDVELKLDA